MCFIVPRGMNLNCVGNGEKRQLAETLPTHYGTSLRCCATGLLILVAATVADPKILGVHVLYGHSDTVVLDLDELVIRIYADLDSFRVGVPRVCDRFGQYGWDVAVKVDPEMIQDIQIHRHFVLVVMRHAVHSNFLVHRSSS